MSQYIKKYEIKIYYFLIQYLPITISQFPCPQYIYSIIHGAIPT